MGRILIIRGGAIGDFILTLPAVRFLRENLPGNHVEILGYPGIAALAVEFGLAEAVRPLEHRGLATFFVPDAALEPSWCDYFASFDIVISHIYDPDDFFHTNIRRSGVSTLLRGPHKPVDDGPHASIQLAKPLESLALFLDEPYLRRPANRTIPTRGTFAIHPGSGSPRKNWSPSNWIEVCRQLGGRFLVVSGEAEGDMITSFTQALADAGVPFESAGSLSLPDLARRLGECRIFLGHDSGISHLAAACGVPCVLVFGPTNPAVWAPPQPDVVVLRASSGDLNDVAAASVIAAIESLIQRTA